MNAALASIVFAFVAVAPSAKETPAIQDRVSLFSPQARAAAQQSINETCTEFGISLNIETINELPGYSAAAIRKMRNRERNELLRTTALNLADEAGSNGLFILIINEPRHVTVVGWPATRELEISSVKRENLRRYLARELGIDPNRALIATCDIFRDMVKSLQARPATPLALPWGLILVGSLLGVWIIVRVLRARIVTPALPIYQPAMFGSLFGVPAGYWINDRLFHAERPVVHAPVAPTPDPAIAPLVEATGDDPAPVGAPEEEHA